MLAELLSKYKVKFICLIFCIIFFSKNIQVSANETDNKKHVKSNYIIEQFNIELTDIFIKIENNAEKTVNALDKRKFAADNNYNLLAELLDVNKAILNICLINADGIIELVAPSEYNDITGKNISAQRHFQKLCETRKPVLSNIINTIEGIPAVIIQFPVFDESDEFCGALSLMIKYEVFFKIIYEQLVKGLPAKVFILQNNGDILYETDASIIGKNILSDEFNKNSNTYITALTEVLNIETGVAEYRFNEAGREIKQTIYWDTFEQYDNEWKIVFSHKLADYNLIKKELSAFEEVRVMESLFRFTLKPENINVLLNDKEEEGLNLFREIFGKMTGAYSIQWIDVKGINKYGFPEKNSLYNFDYYSRRDGEKSNFIKAFETRKKAVVKQPLMEGGAAKFYMQPLFHNNDFAGFIYAMFLE